MLRIEIEKLSAIQAAIEAETVRAGSELLAGGFRNYCLRAPELYIVYAKEIESGGLYSTKNPYPWPMRDAFSLRALLAVAAASPAALKVYLRGLLAARSARNEIVFPASRFDILLATKISTPLSLDHPALRCQSAPSRAQGLVLGVAGTYPKSRVHRPRRV